jgi:hypothetical protein
MKTRAGIRNFLIASGLAAALAIHPSNGRAEDKPATKSHSETEGYDFVVSHGLFQEDNRKPEPPILSVVIEAMRRRYTEANIVFAPELAEIQIPDVKLRAHDLPEMLEAIRVASGNKFDWFAPGSTVPNMVGRNAARPTIDPATGLPVASAEPDPNSGLYVLRVPSETGQNERVVEAFNISSYLESKLQEARVANDRKDKPFGANERQDIVEITVMQLKDLIVQTVASFKQSKYDEVQHNLNFQFHRGATLLVVIGQKSDVEIVRKLMGALMTEPDGMRVRNGFNFAPPVPPAPLEPELVEAIPIKSATMQSAYTVAMSLLNDKRSKVVISDDRTKTLIVSATKAEVTAIKKALDELEKASKPYVGDNPVAN